MKQVIAYAGLLVVGLAACQQQDPNNIAIDEGNSQNAEIETLPPDEGNEETAAANASNMPVPPAPVMNDIPTELHGRWGMVAADCTSTRGDAKGLIEIGHQTIKFYEALATLKERRPASPESFSGLFGFTGEGQTWEKVQTFTRTGNRLTRTEREGTFTYTRCA